MNTEINNEESENSIFNISETQFESIFARLMNTLEKPLDSVKERTASSVIFGYYKGWNFEKTIRYYGLENEIAEKYWKQFNFKIKEGGQNMSRTKIKQNNIVSYLEKNVGQVVTPVKVSTDVSISLPTFYNFYNANRQFFKKIKRGQFEIINPKEQKKSELNS